ncbi:hypothetical protein [uncultured Desulfuromusa sp.]|uniref:hypothetical protein n=1 Tax=uncultured Desulfuromusa sp. TaxID=219183 RepID=UPI002AA8ED92|nr:hypothetical protein [uncultured Desulfuromusa sp.]
MKLSQQMTFLGLAAVTYYAVLLAAGIVSAEMLPQFLVSAIIFLLSGRLIRNGARKRAREEADKDPQKETRPEPDWALRTQILNWGMTILILCALGLWIVKPVGVSFLEFLNLLGPLGHEANWSLVSEVPSP